VGQSNAGDEARGCLRGRGSSSNRRGRDRGPGSNKNRLRELSTGRLLGSCSSKERGIGRRGKDCRHGRARRHWRSHQYHLRLRNSKLARVGDHVLWRQHLGRQLRLLRPLGSRLEGSGRLRHVRDKGLHVCLERRGGGEELSAVSGLISDAGRNQLAVAD
jgi:hypothetical protein